MINDIFAIMNPANTWITSIMACLYCNENIKISIPNEVKWSEWDCEKCKGKLFLTVNNQKITLKKE